VTHTAGALRQIINEMIRGERGGVALHGAIVAVCDGSLLVIDAVKLLDRSLMPRGIRFLSQEQDSSVAVRWMDDVEQAELERQFRRLAGAIRSVTGPIASCREQEESSSLLDIEVCSNEIVQVCSPTLYGYLLGYPCTFEVLSQEQGQSIARFLSSSDLVLYSYVGKWANLEDDWVVLSFSVPKELSEEGEWRGTLEAWRKEADKHICDGGGVGGVGDVRDVRDVGGRWHDVRLRVERVRCRGIVL
jgi:hypothetical protein